MNRTIGVYYNPHAGSGHHTQKALKVIISQLQTANLSFQIIPNNSKSATESWLTKNHITTFVILGGDGTINFIISCIPEPKNITILPIPLGTGNIIAHNAENLNIATATNKQPCLFGASFGFDAAVVAKLSSARTGNISLFSYLPATIKAIFSFKNHKQAVSIDGKNIGNFNFGIIAQTRIYGSSKFHLTTSNENSWKAYLIENLTLYHLLQTCCYGLFSQLEKAPCITCHKLSKITIKPLKATAPVQIDGEEYGTSPLTITATNMTLNILKNINKLNH